MSAGYWLFWLVLTVANVSLFVGTALMLRSNKRLLVRCEAALGNARDVPGGVR